MQRLGPDRRLVTSGEAVFLKGPVILQIHAGDVFGSSFQSRSKQDKSLGRSGGDFQCALAVAVALVMDIVSDRSPHAAALATPSAQPRKSMSSGMAGSWVSNAGSRLALAAS